MPPKKTTAKPAAKPAAKPVATKSTAASKPGIKKHGAAAPKKAAAGAAAAAAPEPGAPEPQPMGETIGLKAISNYLFKEENELRKSKRWVVISDESERSATFLKYANVIILQAMNQEDMAPERLRVATIAGLRYGKPVVIDMMGADFSEWWPNVQKAFNEVRPDLMKAIMDRSVTTEDYFKELIKDSDGDDYKLHMFGDNFIANYMFALVTSRKDFPKDIQQQFFILTVE